MKLKTRKAVAKRIQKTKTGKFLKRTTGQDHYNSKESGKERRNKRRDRPVHKTHHDVLKTALPYN